MKQQEKTTEEAKPEVLQEVKRLEHKLGELCESINCMDAEIDALKLRQELKDERLAVKRLQNALDAALNDVAIWKRAAFWFGVSSALAVVVAIAALGR